MIVDPSAATAAEQGRPGVAVGATLGKYRLDSVLGAGGMGIVWAAFDPDLERAVAIKLLHSSDEPTLRSRLLREARAMARLKHPNVLTVYEVGTDQNRDYIAMEIVDGETLDAWLAMKPPRAEILEALIAAGKGLAAAHAAGLVHRDFKPHNVLRSKDGHVYVTDFGLARGQIEDGAEVEQVPVPALHELGPAQRPDTFDSRLTQTGVMIGTPAYMAPEQFAGRTPDARTDQFAFCITAWEALTGERPFQGRSVPELEKAVAAGARNLPNELPPRIRDVLVRGLEPAADARWPDLRTLLAALGDATTPPRRSRRTTLMIAASAAAIAVGTGVFIAARASSSSKIVAVTEQREACEPARQVFASAWSPARRTAIMKAHPEGEGAGAAFMLDDLQRRWTRGYDEACRAPRTPETRERIACLLAVRDDAARITTDLSVADGEAALLEVLGLSSALGNCTGQLEIPILDQLEPPRPDERVPPVPPTPRLGPVPPAPPAPSVEPDPDPGDPWKR